MQRLSHYVSGGYMSLAKNVMAMLLITGSLWGCSLNAEKEGGEPGSLAGSQWLVEEIDGEPVLEGSEVTIGFTDEGRVFGSSSCNRPLATSQRSEEHTAELQSREKLV